ncbi:uncharacterized protein LTR77_007052 [Saxophila tyrrhenica]|uniref:NACHT domain-containing protein n=1 Tax=Saxophila tyrrhenica TaxID=1690608 RepID=A0AAV9P420_9PEZI|nr:hypothetical protein LTR77_007052 [Saxophila tyrrhenica]
MLILGLYSLPYKTITVPSPLIPSAGTLIETLVMRMSTVKIWGLGGRAAGGVAGNIFHRTMPFAARLYTPKVRHHRPTQEIRSQVPEGRTDPVGLTVLHEPKDVPIADLVFVHSLGGGSFRSWTKDDRPDALWPLTWLSTESLIESARITTYGYSAYTSASDPDRLLDISGFAKDLLAKLRFGHGREDRSLDAGGVPIIFVSHSLGGLIAKKAYLLAVSDSTSTYRQIAQATSAFVFFSTPHQALDEGSVVHDILLACVAGWRSYQTDTVKRHLPALNDTNEKFRDMASPLSIYSFYERPLTRYYSESEPYVLPQDLAILDHPSETSIPLDSDHLSMTKYGSRTDPNYQSVRGALRFLVEKLNSRRRAAFPDNTASQMEEVSRLLRGFEAPQDDLQSFSDRRISGSCEWVLHHPTMHSFLTHDFSQPQLLWCHGKLGSGKSVTATYLIEHLQADDQACAYYYFGSGQQVKNNLNRFLSTIALQLAQQIPEYRRKLCTLAAESIDVGRNSHKMLWKKLFISTLVRCSSRVPFYIVIDGLDEFAQTKELLQKMLIELEGAQVPLRLLLFSRPTPEISVSIERLSKRVGVQRLALDNNAEDLELYVRDEMDVMMGDDDFKEETVNRILAKANGNFLWAHLVVQEILTCQMEEQVEQALRQVPSELIPLYKRMDTRLSDMCRSRPQDQRLGHAIIIWTACARRPLHLDELEIALEHEFPRILDMGQTIQKLCGEFVSVDKKGHAQMMHPSAREFLISHTELSYYVDVRKAHHSLFTRCVHALASPRRDYSNHKDATRAFQLYAASSWPFHLNQSSDHEDQQSLLSISNLIASRAILDWMVMLVQAGNLRALVDASKALSYLLKTVEKADRDRSPMEHRLQAIDHVQCWAQDLIRVVGKFGGQIIDQPKTVYRLLPAFCPQQSILHRQFCTGPPHHASRQDLPLLIRGKLSHVWDDCFAKFPIAGDSLPSAVLSLDRYFAILTKDDGTVHLYYSTTCEAARRLCHGDHVLTFCVDPSITRIATCGFHKTMVWGIESGRLLFSVENPDHAKALAISFQRGDRGEETLLTFSDDRTVRTCSLEAMRIEWQRLRPSLDSEVTHPHEVNAPHNAQFSPDGLYLAISFRGASPAVWYLGDSVPRFVAHFDERSRGSSIHLHEHTRVIYIQAFAWNPLTGHLLGTYYGGGVFKWHPRDRDFAIDDSKCESIKCSADGKLFITGSSDGALRIWDFEHFTPIYQLRYPLHIEDLDLARSEARIYDLREQYCNIWEPTSLLKALESDDVTSDTQSSDMPSFVAESVGEQENFEPITALASLGSADLYVKGDDAGQISICDFDGVAVAETPASPMSIEQLSWCGAAQLLASVDLGREIVVRKLESFPAEDRWHKETAVVQTYSEWDEVHQIELQLSGERLLVVTPDALKVHTVRESSAPVVIPVVHAKRWITHPTDDNLVLGFGPHQVTSLPWDDPLNASSLVYRPSAQNGMDSAAEAMASLRLPNPRRPSQAYPASPSEINQTAHKVFISPSTDLAMVELFETTKQTRRRAACLLMETKHFSKKTTETSIPVCSLPSDLTDNLYISLGFVNAESQATANHRGSFAEHRRSSVRRQYNLSTFVFVDRNFWVCTSDVGFPQEQNVAIRKHFPLPRDWQNAECLDMATVTETGNILCPRNGNVAVVSNGLIEEYDA